jgi:GNAT superfamily N-acetyltransferase
MEIKQQENQASGIKFSINKDGQEVAFGFLYLMYNVKEKPFGLMEYIFVKEECRGQGLGTQIVKAIIKAAKENHCYKLIATSRYPREKVHGLYLRLGFEDWGKEFRMNF